MILQRKSPFPLGFPLTLKIFSLKQVLSRKRKMSKTRQTKNPRDSKKNEKRGPKGRQKGSDDHRTTGREEDFGPRGSLGKTIIKDYRLKQENNTD